MFEWIITVLKNIGANKFFIFLKEVFAGNTGTFLDENYKIINLNVHLAEEIGEYIGDNITDNVDVLRQVIIEKWALELTDEQIIDIKVNKGKGKFELAFALSKNNIVDNGGTFIEKSLTQALRLGIEMAVNRFFGK